MARHFFDSSALAKRYINETGSVWVNALVALATSKEIHLARITGVEIVSAISRRQRNATLSATQAAGLLAQFRVEFANNFRIVEITPSLIIQAMDLAEKHGLRGFDAVQLACALSVHAKCLHLGVSFVMVSADAALNAAALAEGLVVDDPNSHP